MALENADDTDVFYPRGALNPSTAATSTAYRRDVTLLAEALSSKHYNNSHLSLPHK